MGYILESDSKLMYYPTHNKEVLRIMGLLGYVNTNDTQDKIKVLFSYENWRELVKLAIEKDISITYVLYDYFINKGMSDRIKQFFYSDLCYNNNKNTITIADMFAGEGTFLNALSNFKNYDNNSITTIANELDEGRYNNIPDTITEKYNLPFEELQLPKNSLSLMLFNPPYGNTNGVRNVRHYLQMILDRGLLYNSNSDNYKKGFMVFIIRKDDALDSLDLICKNFIVHKNCIYKVHEEEYNKYKQYVIIAKIKDNPYDFNNKRDVVEYQKEYDEIKNIINSEPEFKLKMYENYRSMYYAQIDYNTLKENMSYIQDNKKYLSNSNSKNWNWIKDITKLKDMNKEKIQVPKDLKMGELVNIIASGYLNSELQLEDGTGSHVVIGGVKKIEKSDTITTLDKDNKKVTTTKTIQFSKPYLNILCQKEGKLIIKELGEDD